MKGIGREKAQETQDMGPFAPQSVQILVRKEESRSHEVHAFAHHALAQRCPLGRGKGMVGKGMDFSVKECATLEGLFAARKHAQHSEGLFWLK